jgi:hypothetical protein
MTSRPRALSRGAFAAIVAAAVRMVAPTAGAAVAPEGARIASINKPTTIRQLGARITFRPR